jgi:UDP-N-acetylmuramoyl-L-alanyl-D-glutamate--2,6-diaminopimelate ligase
MVTLREAIHALVAPQAEGSTISFETIGDLDLQFSKVCYDSRQVEQGSLFVCIPGLKSDGHDFAAQAVSRGAVALIVERFLDLPISQVKVKDARQTLGVVAAALYNQPAQLLRMCGVTGTNGKTTVTHLIEHIMAYVGKRPGIIGTLGARIGETEFPGSRTTPEASDLQQLLGEMVRCGCDYAVMEVSSHALDLHRVAGCEYDVAVFTNLTQDHLDYHNTMEEYLAAKAKLFATLGKGSIKVGKKFAVINGDDPAAEKLLSVTSVNAVTYGLTSNANYQARELQNRVSGVEFDVVYPGGVEHLKLKTPGRFTMYNALAAFAVGVEEGLDPTQVAAALAELNGVPGRFELVNEGQPFNVVVDYAHTPDGLENVLKTAREFVAGRIITVFGCGGDRDRTKRPLMGALSAKYSELSIITSDNPRSEQPGQIIAEIERGFAGLASEYLTEPDRRTAIQLACSKAEPGDIVLIAGKGHEDYQLVNDQVLPFDDRLVARECLRGLGYGKANA